MKTSKLLTTGSIILLAAMLFAGCEGITHEPKVDMASLKPVTQEDFTSALKSINVDDSQISSLDNTSFSFEGDSKEYEIVCNIDASSPSNNYYAYAKCVDAKTAKELCDYYYDLYDDVFDAADFSGIKSYETGTDTGYILIDGRLDDKKNNSYTPYHDAIYLKDDTVIVAMASDYDVAIEKEVNTFLEAIGYPHP